MKTIPKNRCSELFSKLVSINDIHWQLNIILIKCVGSVLDA